MRRSHPSLLARACAWAALCILGSCGELPIEVPACTSDVAAPAFAGVAAVRPDGPGALRVEWLAGSGSALEYLVFVAVASGAQDFAHPVLLTRETSAVVSGLVSGTSYYVVVRARDAAGRIDCNVVERAATPAASCATPPCAADSPPTFAGLTSAELLGDGASAQLCWDPGSDVETDASGLVYEAYAAGAEGEQVFTNPPAATSAAGATCVTVTALLPDARYCFVVRARDSAQNRDTNIVEQCLDTPASGGCIEYASAVQPLLSSRCVICHQGASAPQGLELDSYAGVMAGGASGQPVIACQPSTSLLYLKVASATPPVGVRMPFGGAPLSEGEQELIGTWIAQGARAACGDPDPCADTTAPTFSGVLSAVVGGDGVSAELCWAAGTDDQTAAASLVYDVFAGAAPGAESFAAPILSSAAGANCATVTGLLPSQQHCWVVRARDSTGNRDQNVIEQCATTPGASCVDYATMIQPIFDQRCKACHQGTSAPQGLKLDAHANVRAGGNSGNTVVACQPQASVLYQKLGDPPPFGARMPFGGPYLSQAQRDLIGQWIAEGARQSCAGPDPCADSTPPTFAGLSSASTTSATTAQLCWSPGTDDLTPAGSLVYGVFQGEAAGLEVFDKAVAVAGAGQTCVSLSALSPSQGYCWVVRARDGAGNYDGNTVELCRTMPALPAGCVDYATHVQPLLNKACGGCHSGAAAPQYLRLDTYAHLMEGSVRRNTVAACNPGASYLLAKVETSSARRTGKRMPYDGPPFLSDSQVALLSQWIASGARRTCNEPSVCGDTLAPLFAGVVSVEPSGEEPTARVCWYPATDDLTPPALMRYDVRTDGPWSAPVTVMGQRCVDLLAAPGKELCVNVRARDLVGNDTYNTDVLCATPPARTCAVEFAPHVKNILTSRCSYCHSGDAPPRWFDVTSYATALRGGSLRQDIEACAPGESKLVRKLKEHECGARMPYDANIPDGPPFLASNEIAVVEAWVESGARETCDETSPCGDTTPPVFAGLTSAVPAGDASVKLCWAEAADDTTRAASMRYDVYQGRSTALQRFNRPPNYTAVGASCLEVPAAPGVEMCYVVRARDLRGNREANLIERCVAPAGSCFDFHRGVEPILKARCVHCHSTVDGVPNWTQVGWDSYQVAANNNVTHPTPPVYVSCEPGSGALYEAIGTPWGTDMDCYMPWDAWTCAPQTCLGPGEVDMIMGWVAQGRHESCPNGGCP